VAVWSSLEQLPGKLLQTPSRHPSRLGVWEAVWSSSWEAAPDTLPRHPSGTRPGDVLETSWSDFPGTLGNHAPEHEFHEKVRFRKRP